MSDPTKPPAINRKDDPAWAMFAAAATMAWRMENGYAVTMAADYADAMIRERDRRNREERP